MADAATIELTDEKTIRALIEMDYTEGRREAEKRASLYWGVSLTMPTA